MSPNTQRVMVALAEKGLKYELKQVHVMESEHKVKKTQDSSLLDFDFQSRKYLEGMQPFGLFPVLVDEDGFKLYG